MSDGVVFVLGDCYGCRRLFTYNPFRVPSLTIQGERRPFCINCLERVNPRRIANGLAPLVALPGAYEPADESEWINGDDDV
jgi:hypothetical protein